MRYEQDESYVGRTFDSLEGLSDKTLKAIAEMGFATMTEIQAKSLPHLLKGSHLVGTAKTGAGKTLAFLIAAVEWVHRMKVKPRNGTCSIILSPTRELCLQTFTVLKRLMKYHSQTCFRIVGGGNRKEESERLWNGANILVATPGRLLDHMQNTEGFIYKSVFNVIIDEADRMMDLGFEADIRRILALLKNENRQHIVFTATVNKNIDSLKSVVFQNMKPVYVGMPEPEETPTVSTLTQCYLVYRSEERFPALYALLRAYVTKKVIVFFSTCTSVRFHHDLLNFINVDCMYYHGQLKQNIRERTFRKFTKIKSGILLCTDIAARGLDIPGVDLIIQYDPPEDTNEYLHRVGRTARGEGVSGKAILFLRPEEERFLALMQHAKIPLHNGRLKSQCFEHYNIQPVMEEVVNTNFHLRPLALDAFRAYVRSYASHRIKFAFDADKLDLDAVASSFGLKRAPPLDAPLKKIQHKKKRRGYVDNTF
ncbi:probable ATP-dependent RNA helicase pitchoune [Cylas formicarius]|uniref:probable ATP-dependent RNA helicase pitchoune n=1 Tax=Cylas formicarius TaxID=197179 RepID=UPI0029583A95|nr:probable ATP-dependent RNA helicase pitchoune [Cylas formicarius]